MNDSACVFCARIEAGDYRGVDGGLCVAFEPLNPVTPDPPIVHGIPYRLDGQPGLRCAGLAAERKRLQKKGAL